MPRSLQGRRARVGVVEDSVFGARAPLQFHENFSQSSFICNNSAGDFPCVRLRFCAVFRAR